MRLAGDVDTPINPLPREEIFAKGNMANISATIPINISTKPNVVENVHIESNCSSEEIAIYTSLFKEFRDIFSWSYEEMPGIDPSIVKHEIRTYPDARLVQQKLRPVNLCKAVAVKAEVEKLLKASFIYPIDLTDWVSNPVIVNKKQGTIRVSIDFRNLN